MASSVISTSAVASVNRATPAQASMVAPFTGLKSVAGFPVTRKPNNDITSITNNGGRVQCMKVWPPRGLLKFETLSYLPPLSNAQLAKEVDYLLRMNLIPCIEFDIGVNLQTLPSLSLDGHVYRKYHASPGYYDGRYWTMWKLPMFGCSDSGQVLREVEECKKEYPDAFIRIIGFDNRRQVQIISFIVYKPPGKE
ncbi:Ribulose bisphosphate carboxylase small subunit, domain [Dillenia turbinata]|uniref:Ribulose bisphosphate carboxylase small subunit, chloroplastic n=1 Tax=Dillenia turbinata TaxID=194707 RepID=A0AAN8VDJ8_9MAGN